MKILIVSYYFTWSASVGSRRMAGLVRGLAEDGHDVTVIGAAPPDGLRSTPPPGVTVVETAPRDRVLSMRSSLSRLRAVLRRPADAPAPSDRSTSTPQSAASTSVRSGVESELRKWVSFPDTMWEWNRTAQQALRSHERPDLIIASAPPMAGLRAASKLSARFGCPWIADMRDLWTGDPNRRVPRLLCWLDRSLERNTLASASAITTVAEALAAELRETFPDVPTTALRNGFDKSWIRTGDDPPKPGASIVYTGTLTANTGRSIDDLCAIGSRLLAAQQAGQRVAHIDVFGAVDASVPRLIAERDLGSIIGLHGVVSAGAVREAQHNAAALLNLSWESAHDANNLPAKLFEYAAARRPVLHLGRVETLGTALIRQHRLGFVLDPADRSAIVDLIIQLAANESGWSPPTPRDLAPLSQTAMIDGFRQVIDATLS